MELLRLEVKEAGGESVVEATCAVPRRASPRSHGHPEPQM